MRRPYGGKGYERETCKNVRLVAGRARSARHGWLPLRGARRRRSSRRRALTPDSTFTGAKSVSGALAETDPSLLGTHELEPDQRHDQVRLRRDRVVRRRRRRATRRRARSRHGRVAEGQQAPRCRPTSSTRAASRTRSAPPSRRRCRTRTSARRSRPSTAASRRRCRRTRSPTCSRSTASRRSRRTRSSSRRPTSRRTSSARPRLAVARRLDQGRRERRSSACSTPASGPSIRRSPNNGLPAPPGRPPYGCQFGDGSDVAHLGPTFACNQKLDRRVRVHSTRTWPMLGAAAGRVLQQHDRRSARRATPRVTARTRRRRPPATASTQRAALRRRPRPDQRHRSRRARDHVPRLPRAGLLQLRLDRGGPAGDRRRRRRDQLLDRGRREPVHRRGRARVPRRVQRGHLRQRVGRQRRPGRRHRRPRRPVGDDGRRLDVAALVHRRRCT